MGGEQPVAALRLLTVSVRAMWGLVWLTLLTPNHAAASPLSIEECASTLPHGGDDSSSATPTLCRCPEVFIERPVLRRAGFWLPTTFVLHGVRNAATAAVGAGKNCAAVA